MRTKVSICCALTGGSDTVAKNPNVPVTPKEIAAAADEAARAGASMVHIHVRDPETGKESWDKKYFIEVTDRIRQQGTDVIINLTSAIGMLVGFDDDDPGKFDPNKTDFWPAERRMEHILEAKPEVCSLDIPIMNYHGTPYLNLPNQVRKIARMTQDHGIKPELECFDVGDLWATQQYIEEGLFDAPPLIQLCMGIKFGIPATTRGLIAMCDMLPDGCVWGAFGVGPTEMPMVAQSVLMGGNVRVGLEDNLYLSADVLASNATLVERAVEIIERLGAQVATTAEARAELNLDA